MRISLGEHKLSGHRAKCAATTKLASALFATLAVLAFFTIACGGEEVEPSSSPQPLDSAPGFTISSSSLVVTEAGDSDSFTVSLDTDPVSNVFIALTPSDSGEVSLSSEVLIFTAENWDTPQSVTATGVDDWLTDGDISSTIQLTIVITSSDSSYADVEPQTVFVTTIDDELLSGGSLEETTEDTLVEPSGETDSGTPPSGDSTPSGDSAPPEGEGIEDGERRDS